MEDLAKIIAAIGVPGFFFGWLLLRQYLKLLAQRDRLKSKELELKERELALNEKKADNELLMHEQELAHKFKMLELESQKKVSE